MPSMPVRFLNSIHVIILAVFASLLYLPAHAAGNTKIQSFSKAKKLLLKVVYVDHLKTFYCGCSFDDHKQINLGACGYKPKTRSKRVERIEWDHLVPAESFGQAFKEWRDGQPNCVDSKQRSFKGRKCAEKVNPTYRYMQSDMFNLVPSEGEINGLRENFSMAMIPSDQREFGSCRVKISDRKFEPPPDVRGDIARTYLYMDKAYPGYGIISEKNRKLFEAWSKEDPVDAWECTRARRIKELQGNANEFVEQACQVAKL
jgi:deoxyribonuclease I